MIVPAFFNSGFIGEGLSLFAITSLPCLLGAFTPAAYAANLDAQGEMDTLL